MTGGGKSKQAFLITPLKDFYCLILKSMIHPRREHATIFLNGFIFAIGGYDGNSKKMLSSCERYDL
jgi:kelch-like protein 10